MAELDDVRVRRARLRQAMEASEHSLAHPLAARGNAWASEVRAAGENLRRALDVHVEITEGPGGLFEQLRTEAPRLDNAVRRLHGEHRQLTADLADVLAQLDEAGNSEEELGVVRERFTAVLGRLVRHRQSGADLVYEAYDIDIGGE